MGKRGTAVARESADLVLLGDDFGSLVGAIALGRRIEANLHRALGYTLAIHLPIAAVSLLPLLLPGQPLLLLPVHIALLHLVIDPACTVVFEALPATPGLMQQPPRPPEAPLFGPRTWRRALVQGAHWRQRPWRWPCGPSCRWNCAAAWSFPCCCWGEALWCGSTARRAAACPWPERRWVWACGCWCCCCPGCGSCCRWHRWAEPTGL
ncbi:MAG: cation transporting ATPase C-terminal domain-containing protein [Cyanobium sp.]